MPRTKPTEPSVDESEKPVQEKELCGHQNLHSGDLNLTCELPKKHKGNHQAKYIKLLRENPKEVDKKAVSEWSDGAGVPQAELVAEHDASQEKTWAARREKNRVVVVNG